MILFNESLVPMEFLVLSLYKAMIADSGAYHQNIWKGKIPAKIKIFLWLVMNNAILILLRTT
jgi:hypothetical protein